MIQRFKTCWNSYLQLLAAHFEILQQSQCFEAHYALETCVLQSLVHATEPCQERFLFKGGFTYEMALFLLVYLANSTNSMIH